MGQRTDHKRVLAHARVKQAVSQHSRGVVPIARSNYSVSLVVCHRAVDQGERGDELAGAIKNGPEIGK